ncbi:MAG: 3'-5' exonuclease [Patescibacteria group bacterium]|nr:3'-5' exonuclease [Patescibacteria group bacterium]
MKSDEKFYCCLDLETSGFDPLTEEILEIGFVIFSVQDGKILVKDKFSKVFKPAKPVSSRVLQLTGIKQTELDKGEVLADYLPQLQKKLGALAIVGHNVIFDIRFLQAAGLKFSGQVIDTLDLAQIFLPTHHSYNLENLAHTLKLKHAHAHRALSDAQATLALLRSLVGSFHALPAVAQEQLLAWASKAGLIYGKLFKVKHVRSRLGRKPVALKVKLRSGARAGRFDQAQRETLLAHPLADSRRAAEFLVKATSRPLLLVLPQRKDVFWLWQNGFGRGVFAARHRLNNQKFQALAAQPQLSEAAAKFLMKLAVWQGTNWQQDCLLDLNLSFAGGQFLPAVSGQPLPEQFTERVLCCDHESFIELHDEPCLAGRQTVIIGLEQFEQSMTAYSGHRVSWGFLTRLLKSIYDPQTGSGQEAVKAAVEKLLADCDLFFGLAKGLGYKLNGGFGNLKIAGAVVNSQSYVRLAQAAGNFVSKLSNANQVLNSHELEAAGRQLEEFFSDQPGQVKWIELSEWRCVFHNRPLEIRAEAAKILDSFPKASFVSFSPDQAVRDYFEGRLGLFGYRDVKFLKLGNGGVRAKFNFYGAAAEHKIPAKQRRPQALPAAIIVSGQKEVAELQGLYAGLGKIFVSAQSKHGGGNKLFLNFGVHKNNLLLVSSALALKFAVNRQNVSGPWNLPVAFLQFNEFPLPPLDDPYNQALLEQYGHAMQQAIGLMDFFVILRLFWAKKLKTIRIFVPKKQIAHEKSLAKILHAWFK